MLKRAEIRSRSEIVAEEDLVLDVQFLIQDLLKSKGLSRAELAAKIGVSRARLTQLLGTNANPTLRNIARILHGLGERLQVGSVATDSALSGSQSSADEVEDAIQSAYDGLENKLLFEVEISQSWMPLSASNDHYPITEDDEVLMAAA